MKKNVLFLTVLTFAISGMTACGSQATESHQTSNAPVSSAEEIVETDAPMEEDTPKEETPQNEDAPVAVEAPEENAPPIVEELPPDTSQFYLDVLNMYYQNISSNWADYEEVDLENSDVSYLWYFADKEAGLSQTGYQLIDINGDGIEELLVGAIMGSDMSAYDGMFYDLYTLNNGSPVHIASSGERSRYYLGNGEICQEASGGAGLSVKECYHVTPTGLECFETYIYDSDTNPSNPYFRAETEYSESGTYPNISQSEYEEGIAKHPYQSLSLTPFSDFQPE